jgi:hypothetical protein
MAMSRAEELAAIEAAIKNGKRKVLDPVTEEQALARERVMREARSQARQERQPAKGRKGKGKSDAPDE